MRRRVVSDSPYEPLVGFSRAVRVGARVWVAGTGPVAPEGGVAAPGDVYGQLVRVIQIVGTALAEAGASLSDVVHTRVLIVPGVDWHEAARAHAEAFREIAPACSLSVVHALVDPDWLVQMEAEAVVTAPEGQLDTGAAGA